MYLYFNKQGVLKEIVNDQSIRQGNLNDTYIYAYFETEANITGVYGTFILSNETQTTKEFIQNGTLMTIPYDPNRDLKYFKDGVKYQFWKLDIAAYDNDNPPDVLITSVDGLTQATIYAVASGTQIANGKIVFNIESSVIQTDNLITVSEFQYLMGELANKEDKVNIRYDLSDPNNATYPTTKAVKDAIDSIDAEVADIQTAYLKSASIVNGVLNITKQDDTEIAFANIYECTYGTTTYSQVSQALTNKKIPYLKYNNRLYIYEKSYNGDYIFNSTDDNVLYKAVLSSNNAWTNFTLTFENQANKKTTMTNNDTDYPTTKAVVDYVTDLNLQVIDVKNNYVRNITKTLDNKKITIKQYVSGVENEFEFQGGTDVDSELNNTSENPVQNKVIYGALEDKVDKETGKGLSTEDFTAAEKTKLAGIQEGAEVNAANTVIDAEYVHTDNNFTNTLKDKLDGIESGAEVNVQADWNETNSSSDAYIKNKPTIPTVNDGTLTIQKNGTTLGLFSANSNTNETINVSVPTKTSDLQNDGEGGNTDADKFATKGFVNSSIATNTANFLGTYNLVSDLLLTTSATETQIGTAITTKLASLNIDVTKNDYVFVQVPTETSTPTVIDHIDRYKYNGTSWLFEYTLNNSGFTATQWAAINSAITSTKVTNYDNHLANTSNPHNVIKSQVGLGNVDNTSDATKKSNFTGSIASDNTGFATGGDVYSALADKQDTIDSSHKLNADSVDDTNSTNKFVTTDEKATWNGKQDALPSTSGNTGKVLKVGSSGLEWANDNDTTYTAGSNIAISGGVISVNSGSATSGKVLTADGLGGATWGDASSVTFVDWS